MKKYIILIPIYNDRESLTKLIWDINSEIEGINSEISIIVINDASSQQIIDEYQNTENINSIEIINMKENRGHARCIASGLKYIYEKNNWQKSYTITKLKISKINKIKLINFSIFLILLIKYFYKKFSLIFRSNFLVIQNLIS